MAPDHQRIKRVADELMVVKTYDECNYFGGVSIVLQFLLFKGKDIRISELE